MKVERHRAASHGKVKKRSSIWGYAQWSPLVSSAWFSKKIWLEIKLRGCTSLPAGQSPPCTIAVCLPKLSQQLPMEKAKFPAPKSCPSFTPMLAPFQWWVQLLLTLLFVLLLRFVNSQNMRLNKLRIITIMAQFKENLFIFDDQQGTTEERKNTRCSGCVPRCSPSPSPHP